MIINGKFIQIPENLFLDMYLFFCGDPRDARQERHVRIAKGLESIAEAIGNQLNDPESVQIDDDSLGYYQNVINIHKKNK